MCFRSHHLSVTCPLEPHLGPWAWGTCCGCHVGSLWPLSPPPAARSEQPAASVPCSPWLPAGARTPGPAQRGAGGGSGTAREGPGLPPPSCLWFSGPGQRLPAICPSPGPYQKGLFPRLLPTPSPLPLPSGQRGVCVGGYREVPSPPDRGVLVLGAGFFYGHSFQTFSILPFPSPPGSPGPTARVASPGLVRIPFSPNSVCQAPT